METLYIHGSGQKQLQVKRFKTNPLITTASSPYIGNNINGPSVIHVPEWIDNPLGAYYLYFAHHSGNYIRLAYADALQGPWMIYQPGTLHLQQANVFYNHIASPDVHVDHENQQIRMYFHGPAKNRKGQWTSVAFSKDGIHFTSSVEILGKFYFRCWQWQGNWYALAKNNNEGWGELYRSPNGLSPFESRGNFLKNMRHAAVAMQGNQLLIVYSRVGDAPERLLWVSVNLSKDWQYWQPGSPQELLAPEMDYEGVQHPIDSSDHGPAVAVHQLRDPALLVESGQISLFYSVAGEMGIAGARVLGCWG